MPQNFKTIKRSVDPDEIAHFAQLAQAWWDDQGEFKSLHELNPIRLKFLHSNICKHFGINPAKLTPYRELTVLDIGCGGGLISEPIARLGGKVTGIDACRENIEIACAHAASSELDICYKHCTVEELEGTFDVVLALEIVEHVASLADFISSTCHKLKSGGILIISTLNRTTASYLLGVIAAEQILRWVPKGTHQWEKFVRPTELYELLEKNDVLVKSVNGMQYSLLNKCWKLTSNTPVNYILAATNRAT